MVWSDISQDDTTYTLQSHHISNIFLTTSLWTSSESQAIGLTSLTQNLARFPAVGGASDNVSEYYTSRSIWPIYQELYSAS